MDGRMDGWTDGWTDGLGDRVTGGSRCPKYSCPALAQLLPEHTKLIPLLGTLDWPFPQLFPRPGPPHGSGSSPQETSAKALPSGTPQETHGQVGVIHRWAWW